jgi:hypothetical protein
MARLETHPQSAALVAGALAGNAACALYDEAWNKYGTIALWNHHRLAQPTVAAVVSAARALRAHSNLSGRALAERMEAALHGAD